MSVEIPIIFKPNLLPNFSQVEQSISSAGFDLKLESFDLRSDSGFRPATLFGAPAGFEYFLSEPEESELEQFLGSTKEDLCIRLITHADLNEFISSLLFASIICNITQGRMIDPDSGKVISADQSIAWAHSMLEPDPKPIANPEKPWWRRWWA